MLLTFEIDFIPRVLSHVNYVCYIQLLVLTTDVIRLELNNR